MFFFIHKYTRNLISVIGRKPVHLLAAAWATSVAFSDIKNT